MIPVQNIYYMLAYAFQVLNENGYKNIETEQFDNVGELCAAILSKGVSLQLKRGLGKEYVSETEPLSSLRGKIDIAESIKTQSMLRKQLVCTYELNGEHYEKTIPSDAEQLQLPEGVSNIAVFRLQKNPWNSQFFKAVKEVCCFTDHFPYVRFLDFGRTLTTGEKIHDIIRRGVGPSLALMIPVFVGELFLQSAQKFC